MIDYTHLHSTEHELNFIKGMAIDGFKIGNLRHDPVKALQGYISAFAKRTKWGKIDKANVLRYANIKLNELRGK